MATEEAPERRYGAGEDIPGTPGQFPFGLVSFGFACMAMLVGLVRIIVEAGDWVSQGAPYFHWGLILGWLVTGGIGLTRGQWKGFALGIVLVLAPLVILVIFVGSLLSFT